ncbi:MAG: hypothetical protein JWS12_620 [Candidatus Saccharibacteria bacterium]|nr:hypothetical protein [Candidatus Saccharibacteria bacterium]
MNTLSVNKEVEVNAFSFVNRHGLQGVPRTITVENKQYSFVDNGIRYLIQKGQELSRLFDMTDGQRTFRLRHENDHWLLVSIKG